MKDIDLSKLPVGRNLPSLDEAFDANPIIDVKSLPKSASVTYERFRPVIETIDFDSIIPGRKASRQKYEGVYRLTMAHVLRMLCEDGQAGMIKLAHAAVKAGYWDEATLAVGATGTTGVPSFARQILSLVMRGYPRLISMQLFPVHPMTNPDGRIFWLERLYDTAFASSSPNIAVGDRTDDLSKFNVDYGNKGQLGDANLVSRRLRSLLITAITKRLGSISSVEADQDYNALTGGNLQEALRADMEHDLGWIIDAIMLKAAYDNVPPGNAKSWDAQPTINSTAWSAQLPSEKSEYNQTLCSIGINSVLNAVASGGQYLRPNWIVAGSQACEALGRCKGFRPLAQTDGYVVQTETFRDLGDLEAGGVRVIRFDGPSSVLPSNVMLFGYTPDRPMVPAISFCPYRPIDFLTSLTKPIQAQIEQGAITRFGVGKPDVTQHGQSTILAEVYGSLTILNAY